MEGKTMATVIKMKLKRETPGTFVYADESDDAIIPQLYIKKAWRDTPPNTIRVTVEGLKPKRG
jgi:hypothetical protein